MSAAAPLLRLAAAFWAGIAAASLAPAGALTSPLPTAALSSLTLALLLPAFRGNAGLQTGKRAPASGNRVTPTGSTVPPARERPRAQRAQTALRRLAQRHRKQGSAGLQAGTASASERTGRFPLTARLTPAARGAFLLAAAFTAGVLHRPTPGAESSLAAAARALGPDRLSRPVRLEGTLLQEPEPSGRRTTLRLRVRQLAAYGHDQTVEGQARISVEGAHQHAVQKLTRGARLSVWSRISEPRPPGNPGGRTVGGPVAVFGSTKSGLLVRELAPGPLPWRVLHRVRTTLRERLRRSGFPEDVRAVVAAMLLGDRSLTPPGTERAFRDAGTLHLMAVSGLHVGLLGVLLYGALVFLGVRRRHALGLLLVALPLYAALCGGRPSVARAVLMAAVLILGLRRGVFGEALNGLGGAALILLAFSPANALDVGFQLSFGATLAIIAAFRPQDPALLPWDRPPRWRNWILGPFGVTLAAQLGTFPLIAWHFGRVVFGGLLVNVPAGLLAGPVLGLGFAWLALGGFGVPGEMLGELLTLMTRTLIVLSEWGAELPFGAFVVARPSPGWLLLWLALTILALVVRGRRRILPGAALALLALSTVAWREPADGALRLTALDVGMGDALVLTLPTGGAVLVDAGASFDGWSAGETVVAPFLAEAGYRRLLAAVPTHGDLDHVGGFPAVFRDLRVEAVWEGEGTSDDDRFAVRQMHRERERRGIPVRRLRAGERFALGGALFTVLLAGDQDTGPRGSSNESSLVLAVDYAGRRLLLTGDAGAATERILLARYGAELRADVLKVGHHGSRSSTTPAFLEAVRPQVALVSVRDDPRRRLPDRGVLDRLEASGARVIRTDRSGAATVVIGPDGELTVRTFR